jgi:hypothetical protein
MGFSDLSAFLQQSKGYFTNSICSLIVCLSSGVNCHKTVIKISQSTVSEEMPMYLSRFSIAARTWMLAFFSLLGMLSVGFFFWDAQEFEEHTEEQLSFSKKISDQVTEAGYLFQNLRLSAGRFLQSPTEELEKQVDARHAKLVSAVDTPLAALAPDTSEAKQLVPASGCLWRSV